VGIRKNLRLPIRCWQVLGEEMRNVSLSNLPADIRANYECREWRHAAAILYNEFPDEWSDIVEALSGFRLQHSHITIGGGSKSLVAGALDSAFEARGWIEKKWETRIVVDTTSMDSPTHSVDCYKNRIALEIEWSNKDPFYDRDLNNFRLLFDLRVISVGVIITKSNDLRPLFADLGIYSKYGASTTWFNKLEPRIEGGGGGGCPILVFAMKANLYDPHT
jgi:hypothetical protein